MTPRERADAIVLERDIPWQALRDLIQGHIEEAVRDAVNGALGYEAVVPADAVVEWVAPPHPGMINILADPEAPPIGHVFMGFCWCEGCHVEMPDGTRCDRPESEHRTIVQAAEVAP